MPVHPLKRSYFRDIRYLYSNQHCFQIFQTYSGKTNLWSFSYDLSFRSNKHITINFDTR